MPESSSMPTGTAMGTALLRALAHKECGRAAAGPGIFPPESLGSDYLARNFIPAYMKHGISLGRFRSKVKEKIPAGLYEFLSARTAWFDRVFAEALQEGLGQIVLLGAGYDTRALRFAGANRGTRIIELDIPQTQDRKREILKKAKVAIPGGLYLAPIDFHEQKISRVLAQAGYDTSESTLFLWEGVSYYLEPEAVEATLDLVGENRNPRSRLAFDYAVPDPEGGLEAYGVKELIASMRKRHPDERTRFSLSDKDMDAFLAKKGLALVERLDNRQMEERFLAGSPAAGTGRVTALFRLVRAARK